MLEDQIKKETERLASLAPTEPKKEHKKIGGLVEYYQEPLGQRLVKALFENDLKTVATSVVNEVMIPKAKDILADMFISGIQKAIYGDDAPTSTSSSYYSGYAKGPGRKASYDDYYKDGYRSPVVAEEKVKVRWDRIVFREREKAVELVNDLKADLRRYKGGISILEMYDYVTEIDKKLETQIESEFPDNNWGWTNLDHLQIERVSGGWWVKFPKPVRIN